MGAYVGVMREMGIERKLAGDGRDGTGGGGAEEGMDKEIGEL